MQAYESAHGPNTQHGKNLTPIDQLRSDNNTKLLLAFKLLCLCCSPWESWDLEVEGFYPLLPLILFPHPHSLLVFFHSFIYLLTCSTNIHSVSVMCIL